MNDYYKPIVLVCGIFALSIIELAHLFKVDKRFFRLAKKKGVDDERFTFKPGLRQPQNR